MIATTAPWSGNIRLVNDTLAPVRSSSVRAMKFGIDRLLEEPSLRAPLEGARVALLAHPASVTRDLTHSLDALMALGDIRINAAFGPQHGMRGDKQDNMVESADFDDPVHGIPVFSLYGETRKPTGQMLSTFDVVLVDLGRGRVLGLGGQPRERLAHRGAGDPEPLGQLHLAQVCARGELAAQDRVAQGGLGALRGTGRAAGRRRRHRTSAGLYAT